MSYGDLTLHTDKYQINMMYAHWRSGTQDELSVFEAYFRKLPFGNGFAVFAGLERFVRYVRALRFDEDILAYLKSQDEKYDPAFLEALKAFRFTGDVRAMPEGTVAFANEPLVRVEAPAFEAHLLETALLNFINYQTLIATKAARIRQVAKEESLLEFGTRRAQEADAAVWGARAAYLAGFDATSNLRAGMLFGIPTSGTHAHAWVQQFDTEEEAFEAYAMALPNHVTLLVDTYDTLKSGVPNAIRVAKRMEARGQRMRAIRLDSGDLAYLSKEARRMLDEAGLEYVRIVASNDLDENIILNLKAQGAKIDSWGVGTQLITAADQPSLGGVYKLVEREREGVREPVIKISANPEKVSTPGAKNAYRILDPNTGMAMADYLSLTDEMDVERGEPIELFDPLHPYIKRTVERYEATELLRPIIANGELVYDLPDLDAIRDYHRRQLALFWPEHLRKLNPESYPVDLSPRAWQQKMDLIRKHRSR